MSSSGNVVEEQLKEVGNSLLNPPSATEELLKLLDKADDLLENIEQAPPTSMQDALLPLMKALISNELLRHSDVDVKLFVASCITELTRITAPDAPYNDELMKEIFHLTVAAFEKLSHVSSRFYTKAVSILHIVAKVMSSLLMLDLECGALILEMFQHFLNTESNHPHDVFSSMETIMTMVLNENEEIPLDLLKTLLSSVRKENQTISPISWKLGEKVIDNCSAKLKPYLVKAVKSMDISLDDYSQIVASVCQKGSDALTHDNDKDFGKNLENENKLAERSSNEPSTPHVTEGLTPDTVCPREVGKAVDAPTRDEDNASHKSSKTLRHCLLTQHSRAIESRDGAQPDKSLSLKAVKSEVEPYSAPIKRGRKPNSLMNPVEGYDHHWISSGKKNKKPARRRKADNEGSNALPTGDRPHGEAALPIPIPNMTELPNLKPETEGDTRTFLQHNPIGGTQRRRGRPKKQVVADHAAFPGPLAVVRREFSTSQAEERTPEAEDACLRKESQDTGTSSVKARVRPRDIKLSEKENEEGDLAFVHVVVDEESAVPCDPDEKPQQQSALKVGAGSTSNQSSVRRGTKTRRGNAISGKESTEASGSKKISGSGTKMSEVNESTRKVVLKSQCTIEKEEASQMPDIGEQLVGSRINVWWPTDKMFYEGVVSSYDHAKKKHLVLYADGDEESLNLKKQRWQPIDDVWLDVQMENLPKSEASSDTPQKRKRITKSEPSKQANAGLSSKRISRRGISAGISIVERMKSGSKSADFSKVGELIVIDEDEDDQTKARDRLKDNGQISVGKLEADMKNAIDSAQMGSAGKLESDTKNAIDSAQKGSAGKLEPDTKNTIDSAQMGSAGKLEEDTNNGIDSAQMGPETMTLSKGESSKIDTEPSGRECAKELIDLSKGAENANVPLT